MKAWQSTQQMQCSRGLPTLSHDQRIGAIVHRVSHSHMKGHLSLPPFLSYMKWTIKCDWTLQGRLHAVTSKLRCEMPDICRHLELHIQDVVEVGITTNTRLGKDTSGMHCCFKILWSSFNFFPHRTSSVFYNDSSKNTVSWSHETQLSNLGPNPDIQWNYVPSPE